MSCDVCCANYNKSLHSEVKCYFPNCGYSACKECVRTYLTGIALEPHCMKCRNRWSLEFTKTSLNASFMDTDYKSHRRTILADRVIAQIPEFYERALRYGKLTDGDIKLKEIMQRITDHRTIIGELYMEYDRVRREMDNKAPSESKKFVMQCQNSGCRGMLSTQYKCGICTKHTCPKCYLLIEDDHVCKQEDMDTVEELRKNTRPCPNCGLRISKIDGCDQMWCIECKTAFSWSKGTVEKGVVHNPHYYQWMRQNGAVPRNPNEHNEGCGNIFVNGSRRMNTIVSDCLDSKKYYFKYCDYASNVSNKLYTDSKAMVENTAKIHEEIRGFGKYFSGFHRYISHMEYTELRPLHNNIRHREENREPVYRYILNMINKDELSDELIKADNLNMKERAHCDILEALVIVGKQLFIDCLKELEDVVKEFQFSSYINSKMDADNNASTKYFVKTFETHHIFFLPHELERYQRKIHGIFQKYKTAISKYCAYSNIESIKFLITYGSKKTLTMWNYFAGAVDHCHLKTKGEMVFYMKTFQEYYDSVNEVTQNEVTQNEVTQNEVTQNEVNKVNAHTSGAENTFEQSKTI